LAPGSDVGGSLYRSSAASLASFTDGLPPIVGSFGWRVPKSGFLILVLCNSLFRFQHYPMTPLSISCLNARFVELIFIPFPFYRCRDGTPFNAFFIR
jgi:hypothetical protein